MHFRVYNMALLLDDALDGTPVVEGDAEGVGTCG